MALQQRDILVRLQSHRLSTNHTAVLGSLAFDNHRQHNAHRNQRTCFEVSIEMCQKCITNLQEALDVEMAKPVPGNVLIHFDDDRGTDGRLLSKDEVEDTLHSSRDPKCWCNPLVIYPSDIRTAEEIWNDSEQLQHATN